MTRDSLNVAVAALIATLYDIGEPHEAIETLAYMALQSVDANTYTLDAYTIIVGIMVKAKLIDQRYGKLVLTDEGIKLGKKLEESLTEARHGQA